MENRTGSRIVIIWLVDFVLQPQVSFVDSLYPFVAFQNLMVDFRKDVMSMSTERTHLTDEIGQTSIGDALQFIGLQPWRQTANRDVNWGDAPCC